MLGLEEDGGGPWTELRTMRWPRSCWILSPWYQLGTGTVGERFPCAEQLREPSVSQRGALAPLRAWKQLSSALGRESMIRAVRSGSCAWGRGGAVGAWQGQAQVQVISQCL